MILLREQFKGLMRKNLNTGQSVSELCDRRNVFLQRCVENTRGVRKKEASVETPA